MSDETQEKEVQPEKPLDKMTAKELRELAAGIAEITGAHGMKKDELLAAIKKAKGIEETTPAKKKKITTVSGPLTVKEMKAKIVQLRNEREEMRRAGDRKQLKIIRRRINRLKKSSRKAARA